MQEVLCHPEDFASVAIALGRARRVAPWSPPGLIAANDWAIANPLAIDRVVWDPSVARGKPEVRKVAA